MKHIENYADLNDDQIISIRMIDGVKLIQGWLGKLTVWTASCQDDQDPEEIEKEIDRILECQS